MPGFEILVWHPVQPGSGMPHQLCTECPLYSFDSAVQIVVALILVIDLRAEFTGHGFFGFRRHRDPPGVSLCFC